MNPFGYTVKTYLKFSKAEKKQMFVSSVFMALVFFLWSWGSWMKTDYDWISGISKFIFFFIIVFLALFINIWLQKYFAITKGYTAQYSCWVNGSLLSLLLSFISMGWIFILVPGTFIFNQQDRWRLGSFRYGLSYKNLGHLAVFGMAGNVALVLLMKPLYLLTGARIFYEIIFVNLIIAICFLIPIPRIEGIRVYEGGTPGFALLFSSRWLYMVVFFGLIAFAVLALFAKIFSLLLATAIGFVVMLFYEKYIEANY